MRKLSSFTFITLNGYYKGPNEDISWHHHDQEGAEFSAKSMKADNILLFGRVTYKMMASFWPSSMAHETFPDVAKGMNSAEKIVFSKTLKKADWNNSRIISKDIIEEMRRSKMEGGKDMTILGSGSIVAQFAEAGLIDDFSIMIDPVAIAQGTTIFNDINHKLDLKLVNSKVFKSGTVLLNYKR